MIGGKHEPNFNQFLVRSNERPCPQSSTSFASSPLAEKLYLVEHPWADIGESNDLIPFLEGRRKETCRRAAELDANPKTTLTREELWKRVDGGNGKAGSVSSARGPESSRGLDSVRGNLLAERFRAAADACFDRIAAHSGRHPLAFDDVSFAKLPKFPYVVLFRNSSSEIAVLGVFQAAGDSEKFRQCA